MICDQGQVAVVPFPFTDMAVSKYRPALVISNRTFNQASESTMLGMITTAKGSSWPSDIPLADPQSAGLRDRSYVRWKVFTLPNDLIGRTAGTIGSKDHRAVVTALRSAFR